MLEQELDKQLEQSSAQRQKNSQRELERDFAQSNWRTKFTAILTIAFLRLLYRSWRITFVDRYQLDRAVQHAPQQPLIAVFWHGSYAPLFAALNSIAGCVFTSHSSRGRIISQVCRSFNYACIPLPHEHSAAISTMQRALRHYGIVAIAADGPLGPYHCVKRSVVELAVRTGADILPISVASRPRYVAQSRWDRFTIPYPFSRVSFAIGAPIKAGVLTSATKQWDGSQRANIDIVRQALEQNDLRAQKIV